MGGVSGAHERCEGSRWEGRVFLVGVGCCAHPWSQQSILRCPFPGPPSLSPGISDMLIWRLSHPIRNRGRFSNCTPSARLTAHAPTHKWRHPWQPHPILPRRSDGRHESGRVWAGAAIDVLSLHSDQTLSPPRTYRRPEVHSGIKLLLPIIPHPTPTMASSPNVTVSTAGASPLALAIPALDNTYGAIMLGTFGGLM